jgi:hypothetical protein
MKDMSNWNDDGSHLLTSLPVWDSKNFRHLIFVAQSMSGNMVSNLRRHKNISVCLMLIKLLVSIICEIICIKTYTNLWLQTFHVKEKETQCNLMWSLEVSLTKETESLFTYLFVQNSLCFLIQNTGNNCNVSVGLWRANSEYYNTNITDGEYWQCSLVSKLHGCSKLRNTAQPCKI